MFGHDVFESYNYSRPTSYRSYNARIFKPYILTDHLDQESEAIKALLTQNRQVFLPTEGLARGIHWNGYEFGKRKFNHNSHETEYYIHQWKSTNDLGKEHPTGTRQLFHDFKSFSKEVERLIVTPPAQL
jgi:hypothetical protein